jgi:hypothetical protein
MSWIFGDITAPRGFVSWNAGFITWNVVSITWNVAVAAGWGVIISPQFAGITAVVAAMTGHDVDRTGHGGGWGRGDAASGVDVVQHARGDGDETWVVVRKAEGGPRSERAAEDFAKRAGRSASVGRGAENPDSSSGG